MFISSFKSCYEDLLAKLESEDPAFISRIGGSDTDAVVDYVRIKNSGPEALAAHVAKYRPAVCEYNGFYDRSGSLESYGRYCEELIRAYGTARTLLFCNYQLLSLYFKDVLHPVFYREEFENRAAYQAFISGLLARTTELACYPYQFVENLVLGEHTLFRAFSTALVGKKVLVISPFAQSIAANFHGRHGFFKKDYRYPEFDLALLNTPITYAGLPPQMYPDADWFATLNALQGEVSRRSFDIALLSCGSYAMPLGVHIERTLERKAVYVGGVLQLFFGIMGRRYRNPFFEDQLNLTNYIYPLERERYLGFLNITEETAREGFAAYL